MNWRCICSAGVFLITWVGICRLYIMRLYDMMHLFISVNPDLYARYKNCEMRLGKVL